MEFDLFSDFGKSYQGHLSKTKWSFKNLFPGPVVSGHIVLEFMFTITIMLTLITFTMTSFKRLEEVKIKKIKSSVQKFKELDHG